MNNLTKGLFKENPVLVLLLGMCPSLATTTSVINALGMGLSAMVVLICSNAVISALRKVIPGKVRIAAYIVIIATCTSGPMLCSIVARGRVYVIELVCHGSAFVIIECCYCKTGISFICLSFVNCRCCIIYPNFTTLYFPEKHSVPATDNNVQEFQIL